MKIRAGLWSVEKDHADYPSQRRNVKEVIQHPDYKFDNNTKQNDIVSFDNNFNKI